MHVFQIAATVRLIPPKPAMTESQTTIKAVTQTVMARSQAGFVLLALHRPLLNALSVETAKQEDLKNVTTETLKEATAVSIV